MTRRSSETTAPAVTAIRRGAIHERIVANAEGSRLWVDAARLSGCGVGEASDSVVNRGCPSSVSRRIRRAGGGSTGAGFASGVGGTTGGFTSSAGGGVTGSTGGFASGAGGGAGRVGCVGSTGTGGDVEALLASGAAPRAGVANRRAAALPERGGTFFACAAIRRTTACALERVSFAGDAGGSVCGSCAGGAGGTRGGVVASGVTGGFVVGSRGTRGVAGATAGGVAGLSVCGTRTGWPGVGSTGLAVPGSGRVWRTSAASPADGACGVC